MIHHSQMMVSLPPKSRRLPPSALWQCITNKHVWPKLWALRLSTKKSSINWNQILFWSLEFESISIGFTISGTQSKWIVRLMPMNWLNGNRIKLPKNPPIFPIDMTSEDSCWSKGPVGYVLFLLSSSNKLIVPQPYDNPHESVSTLPIQRKIFHKLALMSTYEMIYLQQATARNCFVTGLNLPIFYVRKYLMILNHSLC